MPDPRPWRLEQRAGAPYLERQAPRNNAMDRALVSLASPLAARLVDGPARLRRRARRIEALGSVFATLSDDALRAAAQELRPRFARHGLSAPLVARSFAMIRETTWRTLGLRHHPVQLMGGLAVLDGRLAEMATGEGKTITASLAAATAALAGMKVHVITVNDYLAARDAEELRPIYAALGLTVGCVCEPDKEAARQVAYGCDITYVTGKELGFDYLRDQLALETRRSRGHVALDRLFDGSGARLRLGGLGFAIVDEADSILIDEARTPLIISARDETAPIIGYEHALALAANLRPGEHYRLLHERRMAELTEAGRTAVADAASGLPGVWRYRRAREELAEKALASLHMYSRDRDYIVRDNKVEIVDEYTGRIAEGRKWEHGLHQLIEAKEHAEISPRDRTAARITYQTLFRRYARLSGMTGTGKEHRAEFWSVYGLAVVRVPTHRPVRRRCIDRRMLPSGAARWDAVAASVREMVAARRPVLIGTRSVSASEELSQRLGAAGIRHMMLNARQDADEAEIVAQAGAPGRVTVATNIAGRGTDIRLAKGVAEAGGLHVILTEYHESPRIDRQLIGRGGRQGDPGTWEAIVSIDDALFRLNTPRLTRLLRLVRRRTALDLLRIAAQRVASRRHASDRRAVLAQERQSVKGLAFAGGER